jgi:hypothetical protein
MHVLADALDHADELVSDGHRNGDRLLGPGVPVPDVNVRAADARLKDPYQHVVLADLRHMYVPQPEALGGLRLHQRLHRLLHSTLLLGIAFPRKLRQSSFVAPLGTTEFADWPLQ